MKPDICIHHAPCLDGFTAAFAIWLRWPDIEFHPGVYGADPPDVSGKDILIVDFSYKRPVLEAMAGRARGITILDHHKTAEADLAPFAVRREDLVGFPELNVRDAFNGTPPIQAWFDMTRSGATMAWDYAFPGQPVPPMFRYVEDRDLWRFDLPHTRDVNAALFSHDYSFETWKYLKAELETQGGLENIAAQGAAIERKHHKDIDELLRICTRTMIIGGVAVKVANMPYTLSSDAANVLAQGAPFGACYYDNADGRRVFSLRSKPDGADVSQVAAGYGGGGHARAAGFAAPVGWQGDAVI